MSATPTAISTSTASSTGSTGSMVQGLVGLIFLVAVGYVIYTYLLKPYVMPIIFPEASKPTTTQAVQADTNAAAAGAAVSNAAPPALSSGSSGSKEGFQSQTSLGDSHFFNLQALSLKDTGFLGPYPVGVFNEENATVNALKAGFRFLTLHIDYMETKKDLAKYEAPGEPTLLIRDANGSIISTNSGSIKTVADTIANNSFSPQVPNYTYPVVLYLHFVNAPSAVQNPKKYLTFMSKVASELGSLSPYHLGLTPEGNFTRQKLANELLTTPLKSLEGSVIIMSNADTSLFRNQTLTKGAYTPANDLDFWVNMQVFLDDEADANGITQLPSQGSMAAAVLVNLSRVIGLSPAKQEAFAKAGKHRYVIAMGPRTANPSPKDVDTALNTLGINAVPLDIFTPSSKDILILLNEYSDMSYRKKPFALEYNS